MIKSVTGRIRDPYDNSIIKELKMSLGMDTEVRIVSIDGLGPVDAEISSMDSAFDPGSLFLSTKEGDRNIVMTVEFNPNYGTNSTVALLRQKVYGVYSPSFHVELDIETHNFGEVFQIKGVVESATPVIWSKDPTMQISIICNFPYFNKLSEGPTTVPITSAMVTDSNFKVTNLGEVPVGFKFDYDVTDATTLPSSLRKLGAPSTQRFQLATPLMSGDHIAFSSKQGDRYARYIRYSATNNGLPYFRGSLIENILNPGPNWFTFGDFPRANNLQITYQKLYRGF